MRREDTEPLELAKDVAAGFALWREAMRWQRTVNAAMRSFGLTHSQLLVLVSLDRAYASEGHAVSQRQVAAEAGLDDATTSTVLQTLEKRGFVSRAPAVDDGRTWRVALTRTGARLLKRAAPLVEGAAREFQAGSATRGSSPR